MKGWIAVAATGFLFLPLGACGADMPVQPPAKLRIQYNVNGGKLPRYYQLTIQGQQGRITGQRRRERIKVEFTVSAALRGRLWRVLRRNQFHRITSRNMGKVYDRGGVTVAVAWGTNSIRVSDSGNMFVEKAWRTQFRAIRSALDGLLRDELRKRGHTYP